MISQDKELCNACQSCHGVCPNYCYSKGEDGKIDLVHPEYCCVCGHCLAVCKYDAISHFEMSAEKFIPLPKADISEETMHNFLMRRRSIRNYKNKQVPDELLKKLLKVGIHAGTSSNGQTESFIILQNEQKIKQLESLVVDTLWNAGLKYFNNRIIKKIFKSKYGSELFRQYMPYSGIIKSRRANNDERGMVFRNAPTVIIVHGIKMNFLAQTNTALALRNIEIYAQSMDLGTCWVGFLSSAANKSRKIDRFLNIPSPNTILGALMVGYPTFSYNKILPRKSRNIEWVR